MLQSGMSPLSIEIFVVSQYRKTSYENNFVFQKLPGSENSYGSDGGGAEGVLRLSVKEIYLTLPKKNVGVSFTVSINLGIEKSQG